MIYPKQVIGARPPSAKLDLSPRLDCLGADRGADEPPDGHLQSPVTLTSTNLATVTIETRASNTMLNKSLITKFNNQVQIPFQGFTNQERYIEVKFRKFLQFQRVLKILLVLVRSEIGNFSSVMVLSQVLKPSTNRFGISQLVQTGPRFLNFFLFVDFKILPGTGPGPDQNRARTKPLGPGPTGVGSELTKTSLGLSLISFRRA